MTERTNKFHQGHVQNVLASWPDECVDMAICSPPYWGLRAYDCPPQMWDGKRDCVHVWGEKGMGHHPGQVEQTKWKNAEASGKGQNANSGQFCNKCGSWQGHLGLEPTYQLYMDHLIQVFREVRRVLKRSGSLWVNIGDTYSGSNCGRGDYRENKSLQKDIYNKPSPQSQVSRFSKWRRDGEGGELGNCLTQKETLDIKPKSLIGIPERFVIAMIDDGWTRRNTIIWAKQILHKDNTTSGSVMPGSFQNRFNQSFEYLYYFTKNASDKDTCWKDRVTGQWVFERPQENPTLYWVNRDTQETSPTNPAPNAMSESGKSKLWRAVKRWMGFDNYFDLDAVRVPFTENERKRCLELGAYHVGGRKNTQGEFKHCDCQQCRPRMGNRKGQGTLYDSKSASGLARKPGNKNAIPMTHHFDDKDRAWNFHPAGKNPPTVWAINTVGFPGHHSAVYPEALLERPIKACCPPNGIILDIFMGSGTTALAALSLGRKFVGIDASQKYVDMANKRITDKLPLLVGKLWQR